MKCRVRAALFPQRRELFAFFTKPSGCLNSFPDLGDSTHCEIMDLGLEKNICEKEQRVFGIKRKAKHTLLVTAEQAVERGFTVQITDQMFNDWVRQHQRLLFGIAYWWTGSPADAEEFPQEASLHAHLSRSILSMLT